MNHPFHQQTPYYASPYGGGSPTNPFSSQGPNHSQNGERHIIDRLENGHGIVSPPNSFEALQQLGFPANISQIPRLMSQYQAAVQAAMPFAADSSIPTTALVSSIPAQDVSFVPAPAISLRSRLAPDARFPGLQSVSLAEYHHQTGQTPHRTETRPEVKLESPTSAPMSSLDLVAEISLLQSPAHWSAPLRGLHHSSSTERDTSSQNSNLRQNASNAIRELLEAGVQIQDILSAEELIALRQIVTPLIAEASQHLASRSHVDASVKPVGYQSSDLSSITTIAMKQTAEEDSLYPVTMETEATPSKSTQPESLKESPVGANPQASSTSSKLIPKPADVTNLPSKPPTWVNPTKEVSQKSSVAATLPSKPPPPSSSTKHNLSREEYLAKLAAAKRKSSLPSKTEESSANLSHKLAHPVLSSNTKADVTSIALAYSDAAAGASGGTPTASALDLLAGSTSTLKKNPIKTDLVKQRLEELKRATAAKQALAKQEKDASKSPSRPSTPNNAIATANTVPNLPASTPKPENLAPQNPGPQVRDGSLEVAVNNPRKRLIAADFIADNATPKRRFIRDTPERCVIDVSSDEEDDMEIDDDAKTFRLGTLRSISNPQFGSTTIGGSPVKQPASGYQTPDPKAAERLKQIQTQKQELEARILAAEQAVLKKARAAKVISDSAPPSLIRSISTPIVAKSSSAFDETQIKKLQRKAEMDLQLASTKAKLEELRRLTAQLEEDYERQAVERDEIAMGLEAAGVDTDGMTLTELKETKESLHAVQDFLQPSAAEPAVAATALFPGATQARAFSIGAAPETAQLEHTGPVDSMQLPQSSGTGDADAVISDHMDPGENDIAPTLESTSEESVETGEVFEELPEELEDGEIADSATSDAILESLTPISVESRPPDVEIRDSSSVLVQAVLPALTHPKAHELGLEPVSERVEAVPTQTSLGSIQGTDSVEAAELKTSEYQADEDEMDLESSSRGSSEFSNSPEDEQAFSIHAEHPPRVVDNAAPELQHYREVEDSKPMQKDKAPVNQFSPYESALKIFKAFRYHPEYLKFISGFNSLTYSNKIDPKKCLCPFELAGGFCNDPGCEYQHFRDLSLTGSELLFQLGFQGVHEDPSKKAYHDALRKHINEVAKEEGPSVEGLAKAIVEYRRRYLGDSSNVLDLGVEVS